MTGLMLVSLFAGLASEAFDRLWTIRIIQDFRLPPLLGADNPGVWFAAVALGGSLVALLLAMPGNQFLLQSGVEGVFAHQGHIDIATTRFVCLRVPGASVSLGSAGKKPEPHLRVSVRLRQLDPPINVESVQRFRPIGHRSPWSVTPIPGAAPQ